MRKLSISRRKFVALSAGSAASLAMGRFGVSAQGIPGWLEFHDRNASYFEDVIDRMRDEEGWQPVTATIYGSAANPQFGAVWKQRSGPEWDAGYAADRETLEYVRDIYAVTGFRIKHIAATGGVNDPRFVVIAEKSTIPTAALLFPESVASLNTWLQIARDNGEYPSVLAVYGTAAAPRFVLSLEPNPDPRGLLWNADLPLQTVTQMQTRITIQRVQHGRPGLIQVSPAQRYVGVFRNDVLEGTTACRIDMTAAQYATEISTQRNAGRYPICISANGADANRRFAAVFATSETVLPRQVTRSGPIRSAPIDTLLIDGMRANCIRHASLAIWRNRRLVYARAFRYSDSTYKAVTPTSHFRLASVGKPLVAMLALQMIQSNVPNFTLGTLVQSRLGLKTPSGGDPPAWFNEITIEHLLRHRSGLGDIHHPSVVANAFGIGYPITRTHMVRYGAGVGPAFRPGTRTSYSNMGFTLLAAMIEHALPGETLLSALRSRVFAPLGASRVRIAPALIESHPNDEAAYDSHVLNIGPTVVSAGARTVPVIYGGDFDPRTIDGACGFSAAAPDLAKVFGSLAVPNAVLNQANIDRMLRRDANGTRIGFDGGGADGDAWKGGGGILGTMAVVHVLPNDYSFVVLFNRMDVTGDYYPDFQSLRAVLATPGGAPPDQPDLFPTFGITSF